MKSNYTFANILMSFRHAIESCTKINPSGFELTGCVDYPVEFNQFRGLYVTVTSYKEIPLSTIRPEYQPTELTNNP